MPSGTLTSEPVSTGIAVSRPNCVALRLSVFFSGMPMTPNIIQTMKQTVKASVLAASTDQAWRVTVTGPVAAVTAMGLARWFICSPRSLEAGSTVAGLPMLEHPPVDQPRGGARTMAAAGAIVRSN